MATAMVRTVSRKNIKKLSLFFKSNLPFSNCLPVCLQVIVVVIVRSNFEQFYYSAIPGCCALARLSAVNWPSSPD
jgi:hypothetical protein